jgi:hypothetical protein
MEIFSTVFNSAEDREASFAESLKKTKKTGYQHQSSTFDMLSHLNALLQANPVENRSRLPHSVQQKEIT